MKRLEQLGNQDFVEIQQLWLRQWHLVPGFAAKPLADQWISVLIEYIKQQDRKDEQKKKNNP